uniref:CBS domain-containing protein n=1 Tax=Hemiselmis andersenii TaxID=464988 RepID=A0A6T8GWV1_HEMAN|mmetsp:Transcript_25555/g.59283  ORF Transcript_25555/g.59283 Transcript_25555/m.59283 type:complete len:382 (+) Transcript_25555:204-1349(+)
MMKLGGGEKKFDLNAFGVKMGEFLESHTVAELPLKDPVLCDEGITPAEAFKVLSDNKIRACPVKSEADTLRIIGCMDQRDAVLHVLDEHRAKCAECKGLFHALSFKSQSFKEKAEKERTTQAGPRGQLTAASRTSSFSSSFAARGGNKDKDKVHDDYGIRGLASMHPFRTFPPSALLVQVTEAMAQGEYMVGVSGGVSDNAGLKGMIDQIAFINFLSPCFHGTKIQVKDIYRSSVLPVKTDEQTIKAFELMVSKGSSGLAVVDESGMITQNFSTSDIKIYFDGKQNLSTLHLPIEDYLAKKVDHAKETKSHQTRAPISVCHADDDLAGVITKMVKTGYHRVWVVDLDKKPLGILSLTDVFRKVSHALKGDDESKGASCSLS